MKKLACALLAIACALTLTACWDYVEVNTMLILAGIGLDLDSDGKTYCATVEFVNVEAAGNENIVAEMVKGKGETIHNAIQNALLTVGGTMFANHCKVMVVGEALAKEGLSEIVEVILRSPGFRKTVEIMVAKDTTAADIFSKDTVINDIVSYELSKILQNNEKSTRSTVSVNSYQVHEALLSTCSYCVLPTIYVKRDGDQQVLMADGCAIVADGKLAGFLSGEESKLYQLITRRKQGVMVTTADQNGRPIDVNITDSNISLLPQASGDTLSMRVEIRAQATLEEAALSGINPMEAETRDQIEEAVNRQLSTKVAGLISRVREQHGSDIFEFYAEFQDNYRQQWNTLEQDWPAHFREMEIQIRSDVRITGSGLIGDYAAEGNDNAVALP